VNSVGVWITNRAISGGLEGCGEVVGI
jgi:hypothetical protein